MFDMFNNNNTRIFYKLIVIVVCKKFRVSLNGTVKKHALLQQMNDKNVLQKKCVLCINIYIYPY